MNIVDSCLWLEFFAGSLNGKKITDVIKDTSHLYVPSIVIYEVFKKVLIEVGEEKALLAIAHIKQGMVIDLTEDLALFAAILGRNYKLPMADSIIYASTLQKGCTLWTQDDHFKGLKSVVYWDK